MKSYSFSLLLISCLIFFFSCNVKGPGEKDSLSGTESVMVPDTGYTGIKQFMSGEYIVSKVTYKNGVLDGLKETFYKSGKLRLTYWYENGLREDSSKWYHQGGQLFRSTPFKRDTMDGTQIQYYKNGRIKAKMNYIKGLRTPFLEEYTKGGTLVSEYPELEITTKDLYKTNGHYSIILRLSDKSTKVKYYRGDFTEGVFDPTHCRSISTINGTGTLDFKKIEKHNADYVGVIAVILTSYGNRKLVYRKIDLPYSDLN
jgi:antitoxin component YwqK of YwqJK toxin-antitoxin module